MSSATLPAEIPVDQIFEKPTWRNFRDLEGQRFGRLLVVAYGGKFYGPKRDKNVYHWWWVRCDCGGVKRCSSFPLRRGLTRSCGCWREEIRGNASVTHGGSRHPRWKTYYMMVHRCTCEASPNYKHYGARGIRVHPPWVEDCWLFFAYIETLPHYGEEGRTLDRINNDGNYEPGNLRWATQSEQMKNSRRARWLTRSDGLRMGISDWGAWLGGGPMLVTTRLRLGWTLEEALWTPKGCTRRSGPVE